MKHPDIFGIRKIYLGNIFFCKKLNFSEIHSFEVFNFFEKFKIPPEIHLLRKAFVKTQFYLFV